MDLQKTPGLNLQYNYLLPRSENMTSWGDFSRDPDRPRKIYHQHNFFQQLKTIYFVKIPLL